MGGLGGGCAKVDANRLLWPRARGFNGDSTLPDREGGRTGPSPPVTFRRIGGRVDDGAVGIITGMFVGFSPLVKPENGVVSVPKACLRAFSCLPCTDRKCESNSCHFISSRPNLERVDEMFPTVLCV